MMTIRPNKHINKTSCYKTKSAQSAVRSRQLDCSCTFSERESASDVRVDISGSCGYFQGVSK